MNFHTRERLLRIADFPVGTPSLPVGKPTVRPTQAQGKQGKAIKRGKRVRCSWPGLRLDSLEEIAPAFHRWHTAVSRRLETQQPALVIGKAMLLQRQAERLAWGVP